MLDLAAIKARAAARLGAHAHPQTPASLANWLVQPTEISQLATLAGVASRKPIDPDRWCWPASDAMNGAELQTFTGRVVSFIRLGITDSQAELVADRLVIRDRQHDDRRLCLECTSYRPGRCDNHRRAGLHSTELGGDLVTLLQRCPGFAPRTEPRLSAGNPAP